MQAALSMNATLASKVVTKNAARSQRRSVVVRAEEAAAPKKEAPKAWTAPTLDPNTPSPIFGGSTGTFMILCFRRPDFGAATRVFPRSRASGHVRYNDRNIYVRKCAVRRAEKASRRCHRISASLLTRWASERDVVQGVCFARPRSRSSTSSRGSPRRSRSSRCRREARPS